MANQKSYNDRIDAAKEKYNNATTKAEKDAAHAEAEAARAEASNAGYSVGNYVSSGSGSKTKMDTSNYSSNYDVATNYYRPSDEEPVVEKQQNRDELIDSYVNAQKQAQAAALQNAYNNTLNEIAKQEKSVQDQAITGRNQASVQNQLSNQRLASYLANNGLTNSGTNAQMQINSAGALQNNLGAITTAEQNALAGLGDQRVLAKSNLENDIASANAGIDATKLQYQLAQLDSDDEYKKQLELLAIQNGYDMDKLKTQLDYEYIWDDTLGRRVPFETYMYTHPQIMANYQNAMPKTTTGGGSASSGSELSQDKLYGMYINYIKATGDTTIKYEDWLKSFYGIPIEEEEPDLGAYIKNNNNTKILGAFSKEALDKVLRK